MESPDCAAPPRARGVGRIQTPDTMRISGGSESAQVESSKSAPLRARGARESTYPPRCTARRHERPTRCSSPSSWRRLGGRRVHKRATVHDLAATAARCRAALFLAGALFLLAWGCTSAATGQCLASRRCWPSRSSSPRWPCRRRDDCGRRTMCGQHLSCRLVVLEACARYGPDPGGRARRRRRTGVAQARRGHTGAAPRPPTRGAQTSRCDSAGFAGRLAIGSPPHG